jgi:hypothetical protein
MLLEQPARTQPAGTSVLLCREISFIFQTLAPSRRRPLGEPIPANVLGFPGKRQTPA